MRRTVKLPVIYLIILPTAVLVFYLGVGDFGHTDKLQSEGINSKLTAIKTSTQLKDYNSGDETPADTPGPSLRHHTPEIKPPVNQASKDTPVEANDSPDDATPPPDDPLPLSSPPPQPAPEGKKETEEKGKIIKLKTILVWNNGYGVKTMGFGEGRQSFVDHRCEVNTCYLTSDRSYLPLTDYDAVIFHLRPTTIDDLPPVRSPRQRWILWEVESASYTYQDLAPYAGLFNWTMTYRHDSDIPFKYGRISPTKPSSSSSSSSLSSRNYAKGKTKVAAWFASNCLTHSRREKIVQFMKDLSFEIDVYGKCGKLKCPRTKENKCHNLLDKHYKFYLSFENSLCQDYVTEKLFSILKHDVVPVVFGLANYTKVAPPNSFVNVLDFSSVKGLIDHLKYLDSDDKAYNKYFRWKGHYKVLDGFNATKESFCALCKKLHEDNTPKVYEDIKKWFVLEGGCKRVHGMPLHFLRSRNDISQKYEILIKDHPFESYLNV